MRSSSFWTSLGSAPSGADGRVCSKGARDDAEDVRAEGARDLDQVLQESAAGTSRSGAERDFEAVLGRMVGKRRHTVAPSAPAFARSLFRRAHLPLLAARGRGRRRGAESPQGGGVVAGAAESSQGPLPPARANALRPRPTRSRPSPDPPQPPRTSIFLYFFLHFQLSNNNKNA